MPETRISTSLLREMSLPEPAEGGKEERGRVLVIAGSREVPGAALLAGLGALRIGAGKLQIATAHSVATAIGVRVPESRVLAMPETLSGAMAPESVALIAPFARECDALLIGPGLIDADAAAGLAAETLARAPNVPAVVDATAMMRLRSHAGSWQSRSASFVMTPHFGELAGILGIEKAVVERDPARIAAELAQEVGCIVVLKGRATWIATPDGQLWRHDDGHIGLATSGSGDVLAGFIAGLLARGAAAATAAIWGVFVHAQAGERLSAKLGPLGYLARELLDEAPRVLVALAANRG